MAFERKALVMGINQVDVINIAFTMTDFIHVLAQ